MKRSLESILFFIPAIVALSFLTILADKTGKLGVLGTLITLLINPDNFELRYNKKIHVKIKLRIIYIKEFLLSFFCSCYITYIVNHFIKSKKIQMMLNLILPTIFFIIIWLYVRVIIPKIIYHFNDKIK